MRTARHSSCISNCPPHQLCPLIGQSRPNVAEGTICCQRPCAGRKTPSSYDHPLPRPLRLRARLPRQRYLPKAESTSCWRRNLIINRSACSTVCLLVACPETFCASAISLSSISILVRIPDALLLCVAITPKAREKQCA